MEDDPFVRQMAVTEDCRPSISRTSAATARCPSRWACWWWATGMAGRVYHRLPPQPPLSLDVIHTCTPRRAGGLYRAVRLFPAGAGQPRSAGRRAAGGQPALRGRGAGRCRATTSWSTPGGSWPGCWRWTCTGWTPFCGGSGHERRPAASSTNSFRGRLHPRRLQGRGPPPGHRGRREPEQGARRQAGPRAPWSRAWPWAATWWSAGRRAAAFSA